jgi:DNA-binding response OmpR family regulator
MSLRADDSQSLSVLVVDDSRDAADSLAAVLRLHGYAVQVAYDAETAMHIAQAVTLDAVLLDIAMPKCNGYQLVGRLRAVLPAGVLYVAVTGFGTAEDKERALREGFDHHLLKPADLAALDSLLAEVSRRRSA